MGGKGGENGKLKSHVRAEFQRSLVLSSGGLEEPLRDFIQREWWHKVYVLDDVATSFEMNVSDTERTSRSLLLPKGDKRGA